MLQLSPFSWARFSIIRSAANTGTWSSPVGRAALVMTDKGVIGRRGMRAHKTPEEQAKQQAFYARISKRGAPPHARDGPRPPLSGFDGRQQNRPDSLSPRHAQVYPARWILSLHVTCKLSTIPGTCWSLDPISAWLFRAAGASASSQKSQACIVQNTEHAQDRYRNRYRTHASLCSFGAPRDLGPDNQYASVDLLASARSPDD